MYNLLQKFADYREERRWISTAVGTLWYRDNIRCFPDRRNFSSFNRCVEDLGKYRLLKVVMALKDSSDFLQAISHALQQLSTPSMVLKSEQKASNLSSLCTKEKTCSCGYPQGLASQSAMKLYHLCLNLNSECYRVFAG